MELSGKVTFEHRPESCEEPAKQQREDEELLSQILRQGRTWGTAWRSKWLGGEGGDGVSEVGWTEKEFLFSSRCSRGQ